MITDASLYRVRLKYRARIEMGQSPPSTKYSHSSEDGLPFLQGTADFGAASPTPRVYCGSPTKLARAGDILFSVRAPVGDLNLADQEFGIGRGLCAIRPQQRWDARFAWWALHEACHQLNLVSTGSTYDAVAIEDVGNLLVETIAPGAQRAIADYLDRETARLDALVAAKERVLGLLAEKRRALITRAVTRGLDPNVPFRDSGIPWLGEIPAHWGTSKFTWSVFIIEGQVDPKIEPYVNMPLIAPNHLESETGRLLRTEMAADQGAISGKYLVSPGDVIYSKIRPALRKATMAVEQCLCSADMYPLRSREDMEPEFLLFFLLSEPFSTWAVLESNRVAMPKINREALGGIRIPLPPPNEQHAIVAHIANETRKLDELRAATERTTVLLKERRAALIAAAVTGQIEVGSAA